MPCGRGSRSALRGSRGRHDCRLNTGGTAWAPAPPSGRSAVPRRAQDTAATSRAVGPDDDLERGRAGQDAAGDVLSPRCPVSSERLAAVAATRKSCALRSWLDNRARRLQGRARSPEARAEASGLAAARSLGLVPTPRACSSTSPSLAATDTRTRGTACGRVCSCVQRRVQPPPNRRWLSQIGLESQSACRGFESLLRHPAEELGACGLASQSRF
jgi:hypothetical protein